MLKQLDGKKSKELINHPKWKQGLCPHGILPPFYIHIFSSIFIVLILNILEIISSLHMLCSEIVIGL